MADRGRSTRSGPWTRRCNIYNTFKSKHELFQRALHRYLTTMNEAQLAVLEDPARSGADRIRALFVLVLDGDAGNRPAGRSLGCLSVNTTVELAGRDAVAAGILERDTALRLAALRRDGRGRPARRQHHLAPGRRRPGPVPQRHRRGPAGLRAGRCRPCRPGVRRGDRPGRPDHLTRPVT
ncbi:hypothetical protein GCM10017687_05730 [Streptomyces echinatus]|uniref:hypothetical protein n=1 Tax=Streptomyces echinatus TaxID=67293 RepID=UPI0031EAEDF4